MAMFDQLFLISYSMYMYYIVHHVQICLQILKPATLKLDIKRSNQLVYLKSYNVTQKLTDARAAHFYV